MKKTMLLAGLVVVLVAAATALDDVMEEFIRSIFLSFFFLKLLIQSRGPHGTTEHERQKHGGAAHVLGALGELMQFRANPVNGGFNPRVEQFGHQHQHDDRTQHRDFQPALTDIEGQRQQHDREACLHAKRLFPPACHQSLHGIEKSMVEAIQPGTQFVRVRSLFFGVG